ncbi:MAG TPA: SOS response-associated peptidase [Pelomicrobium sp.]|nr:SOS response-associated peptidase [Pelomicrobium sp.]
MCGRYALHASPEVIALQFGLAVPPPLTARYNIAPTSDVLIVRGEEGGPVATTAHWGLIPSWAKDPAIGNRMANARAETAHEKPSFRTPFRYRRCLIPASGFYEWRAAAGGRGPKQPFYIHPADDGLFGFAGLYEVWKGPDGPVTSCTILTMDANPLMARIHDRMPVIVAPERYGEWLDPQVKDPAEARAQVVPFPAKRMAAHPVSTRVNRASNEGAGLIEPLPDDAVE